MRRRDRAASLAASFVFHGAPKVVSMGGHRDFVQLLTTLGVPLPDLAAWLVGGVEILRGIAMLMGLCVRRAALLLLADMILLRHPHHGHGSNGPIFGMPGYEVSLLASLLALLMHAAGAASADAAITERSR
jgi:putative oxidoreductase